ncbi:hypothetical protein CesoFtcFv8_025067 [Champsocephalus esox]|uniref:Uncharacterized protein n=1 Tax=Champsocephalus esox TaxID=159716 RepID=A0AAN8B332_9TELE|nr:hypothetical protein CesoFtcFv8_025067 [Champsocephalus esox]
MQQDNVLFNSSYGTEGPWLRLLSSPVLKALLAARESSKTNISQRQLNQDARAFFKHDARTRQTDGRRNARIRGIQLGKEGDIRTVWVLTNVEERLEVSSLHRCSSFRARSRR